MASPIFRFGAFRLDPARRELWRDDEELALQRLAFDCIHYLVEHRDRAVSRDELIAAVWGEVHLTDNVLSRAIALARRALDDTGEEQRFIETVQRFGYRWAAPVEVEGEEGAIAAVAAGNRRQVWRWVTAAILSAGILASAAIYLRWGGNGRGVDAVPWQMDEGEIALLLPVTVEPEDHHSWIRFGVMELIADRLRAAGQPMVPSETVIALARGLPPELDAEGVDGLTSISGARLILGAHAEAIGTGWRLSVRSLNHDRPPLSALAEADNVLDAARISADRLALAMGFTPAPEPDSEPGLAMLLRQTEAAMLAQQMDIARDLIESAEPELREHPEVRLQLALIEFNGHRIDVAQTAFESLLDDPTVQRDRVLRARVLHGLGGVYFRRGAFGPSEAVLEEAAQLLGEDDAPGLLGHVRRSLGLLSLIQGRLDAARDSLAQARRAHRSTGDAWNLAVLEGNLGLLEALRERYAEALYYFERSADGLAALHDVGGELNARAHVVEAQLGLLESRKASTLEPRLQELAAQTTNPAILAHAELVRAALLEATGRLEEAEALLAHVWSSLEAREDVPNLRMMALILRAERLLREDEYERAGRQAAEVVEQALLADDVLLDDSLGRAWLVLLRSQLRGPDLAVAGETAAAMRRWAQDRPTRAPRIFAALATAELAAAEGRGAVADLAYERAVALADSGQVPLRLLQVAESYVPWLLREGAQGAPDPEMAFLVADRVARYADQDYRTALLLLRVHHALGPTTAWRAAFDQARALAGERQIPAELRVAPQVRRFAAGG